MFSIHPSADTVVAAAYLGTAVDSLGIEDSPAVAYPVVVAFLGMVADTVVDMAAGIVEAYPVVAAVVPCQDEAAGTVVGTAVDTVVAAGIVVVHMELGSLEQMEPRRSCEHGRGGGCGRLSLSWSLLV